MKVSLEHLKSYVEINVSAEELCDRMVLAGFEVESIEKQGDNLVNVVAARIMEIAPHEDSDHLQICQMDTGAEELVQIVTGAQNIKVGDLVPAALNDSYLPCGAHIVNGKLRGTMMIAKDEAKENVIAGAKENENVKSFVDGKTVVKEIYVPGKLVNIVVR